MWGAALKPVLSKSTGTLSKSATAWPWCFNGSGRDHPRSIGRTSRDGFLSGPCSTSHNDQSNQSCACTSSPPRGGCTSDVRAAAPAWGTTPDLSLRSIFPTTLCFSRCASCGTPRTDKSTLHASCTTSPPRGSRTSNRDDARTGPQERDTRTAPRERGGRETSWPWPRGARARTTPRRRRRRDP